MHVLIAEDSALFREGLARLLTEAGHVITAAIGDADEVDAAVELNRPDLVIMDVRMPPTMTDDGAQAATRLRQRYPELPILLLSQHIETRHCAALATTNSFGYLLKDRVLDVDDFLDAMQRVVHSGSALDPEVVRALIAPRGTSDPLRLLTEREIQVLELVARGLSNAAIGRTLTVAERTVESHMRSIFTKLGLIDAGDSHRRVRAVLAYLLPIGSPHNESRSINQPPSQ